MDGYRVTSLAPARLGDMGFSCPGCGRLLTEVQELPSPSFVVACGCGTGCYWRVANPRITPEGGMAADVRLD